MKKISIPALLVFLMAFMSSCQVIGDIFKAGVWVGVIIVVVIIVLVIWILSKIF